MKKEYDTGEAFKNISHVSMGRSENPMSHGIVDAIIHMAEKLSTAFQGMKAIPGMYDDQAELQHHICSQVPGQITSGLIRIAVVGAIKSGKSTCINAMTGAEILKRGAGVITAMVTRIRPGKSQKARVFLKSWDEVNEELRRALVLFPENLVAVEGICADTFDLRRKKDRGFLQAVAGRLGGGHATVVPRGLQPEFVRIRQALDAYDRVRHLVQADAVVLTFKDDEFYGHQMFTGDGSAAFFANDVLLELPGNALAPGVEMADCQGSDSTDPAHLAQIQDYLVSANMIIYVISSRMGVRRADIVFLQMIQEMGLMDNLLFLFNVDLGEHHSLDELKSLEAKVKDELACVHAQPFIHSLSCLHGLYCALGNELLPGEKKRISLWEENRELMRHTLEGEKTFMGRLEEKIQRDRFSLVVENHIQRLGVACDFTGRRIELFYDLLSRDQDRADHAVGELKRMKAQGANLKGMIKKNTLSAVEALETDIRARIHRFFHPRKGALAREVKAFINDHPVSYPRQEQQLAESGFNQAIYTMFQEFRTAVDYFMARQFTPRVAAFIKEQEQRMETDFMVLYDTCHMDTRTLMARLTVDDHGLWNHGADMEEQKPVCPVDISAVKGILGLEIPRARMATAYSARIRVDAMAGLGVHSLVAILSRILKKNFASPFDMAFANGERRMRKEALRCMELHFKNYRELLETDYFLKLIHAVSRDFQEKMVVEFEGCDLEMSKIEALVATEHTEKIQRRHNLEAMIHTHGQMAKEMDALHIDYPH
ncbi:dynamin family protein [Desulfocicer vacuolatum]|uniref:dynamin family protein n=1 Tax=Desulfocicer vacuolatum TaxID=2298 RepID=UPI0014828C43|nr:dynamin family protein [Desulfocicer vacuolatum]